MWVNTCSCLYTPVGMAKLSHAAWVGVLDGTSTAEVVMVEVVGPAVDGTSTAEVVMVDIVGPAEVLTVAVGAG